MGFASRNERRGARTVTLNNMPINKRWTIDTDPNVKVALGRNAEAGGHDHNSVAIGRKPCGINGKNKRAVPSPRRTANLPAPISRERGGNLLSRKEV
jgi:hypothetical protein